MSMRRIEAIEGVWQKQVGAAAVIFARAPFAHARTRLDPRALVSLERVCRLCHADWARTAASRRRDPRARSFARPRTGGQVRED